MKKVAWFEHLTPFLFAIFPVLSLAYSNIEFANVSSILRSLLLSIFTALIIYIFFNLILRKPRKSAILSAISIFLLLTYGNVYMQIEDQLGEAIRHRNLIGIYILVFMLIGAFIVFKLKDAKDLNMAVFTSGLVIVIYLMISIGIYEFKVYQPRVISEKSSDLLSSNILNEGISNLPDIYYIVLDGHTRSDVLKNVYGYDNSEFIDQLEEIGFLVADCAQSNYPGTNFSITSVLEMDYLHNIYQNFDDLVFPPLNRTLVYQILENNGYKTASFQNYFFEHFDVIDDFRLSKEDKPFGIINEFEMMVVDTSIMRILIDIDMEGPFPKAWVRPFKDNVYLDYYRDVQYALDTLPELPEMDEQLFVYAHLMVTHDPFVFLADGSFNTLNQSVELDYRNTVEFIDNTLPSILKEIIDKSEEPPIIIIMGDHGAPIKGIPIEERMSILFAIYTQGQELEKFHENITPVNAYRLVFDYLFNENIELIEDKSYGIWNLSGLGNTDQEVLVPCNP